MVKGLLGSALVIGFVLGLNQLFLAMLPDMTEMSATYETQQAFVKRMHLPVGFKINLYATGLGRARGMAMTPAGDFLIASPGVELKLVRHDDDGDGRTDGVETLMDDLRSPHGLWLDENWLYVAETGRIIRIRYDVAEGKVVGKREIVVDGIPQGDGYWTRTVKKGPDGWFYVSVGSSCNACVEKHPWRAAIIRFQPGESPQVFASGLRNTVGFDWRPGTGALYGVDNGRNYLGDDVPPDEVNLIVEGGFYGWPYFYGANVADPDFGGSTQEHAGKARKPVHELVAHAAPLAIHFLRHLKAPGYENAALVTQHGSWNRRASKAKVGFDIVSLHWSAEGEIAQRTFLTGFDAQGDVSGRPVDITEGPDGTLYITDDFSGAIWRITYETPRV